MLANSFATRFVLAVAATATAGGTDSRGFAACLAAASVPLRKVEPKELDYHTLPLDLFVRKMVLLKDFSNDRRWDMVQRMTRDLTAKAGQLANKRFYILDKKLTSFRLHRGEQLPDAQQGEAIKLDQERILLDSADERNFRNFRNNRSYLAKECVIFSVGSLPSLEILNHSVCICIGDLPNIAQLENSLLIVHGNIGRLGIVRDSIVLATGRLNGAHYSQHCLYQGNTKGGYFRVAENNTFVGSTPDFLRERNNRFLDSDRGPLKLLRFSAITSLPTELAR